MATVVGQTLNGGTGPLCLHTEPPLCVMAYGLIHRLGLPTDNLKVSPCFKIAIVD